MQKCHSVNKSDLLSLGVWDPQNYTIPYLSKTKASGTSAYLFTSVVLITKGSWILSDLADSRWMSVVFQVWLTHRSIWQLYAKYPAHGERAWRIPARDETKQQEGRTVIVHFAFAFCVFFCLTADFDSPCCYAAAGWWNWSLRYSYQSFSFQKMFHISLCASRLNESCSV